MQYLPKVNLEVGQSASPVLMKCSDVDNFLISYVQWYFKVLRLWSYIQVCSFKVYYKLTASDALGWVSTASTSLLLDVVTTAAATPTEGVRLVVPLTKA